MNMDRVVEQIRHWRDELINLSRRDRVLFYRPTKSASLIIEEPGVDRVVAVLERSNGSWGFFAPPEPEEPREGDGSEEPGVETEEPDQPQRPADELLTQKPDQRSLANSLRLLDRRTTQEFMDKGIWVLYLAAGFLNWIDPDDDRRVKTPIVLKPVDLRRSSPKEPYRLRASEEETVLNPALSVKMESEFGIQLPEIEDTDDWDLVEYLGEFERAIKNPEWSVSYESAIDIFSFYKEVMYKDLKDNEERLASNDLVRALALGDESDVDLYFEPPSEEDLDERYPAEEMATIRDADASQRRSIVAAREGHSFVMDGPPGTGKSQTISNMIAQALHDGRTVLFVSEKIAALEVVKGRLDEAGLGEYLLELHSHKATRKEVAQSLYRALRTYPHPPRGMGESSIRKLTSRRRELSAYAAAMNETRQPLERSLHSAMGRISRLSDIEPAPVAIVDHRQLDVSTFNTILEAAADLSRAWGPVERGDEFLWRGVDVEFASVGGKRDVEARLDSAQQSLAKLRRHVDALAEALELWWNEAPAQAERLLAVLAVLEDVRPIPPAWLTAHSLDRVLSRSTHLRKLSRRHAESVARLDQIVGSDWRRLNSSDREAFAEARAWLSEIELPWPVDETTAGSRAGELIEFNRESLEATERVKDLTESLAVHLGLDPANSNIGRSKDLLSLAGLTSSPSRPEADWLDGVSLPRVREAAEVLGSLARQYRDEASELDGLFKSSVLHLDAESLKSRFETEHTGLSKLSRAYRADKRLLAGHTHQGKASKEAISALDAVIEWQRIAADLEEAERSHAASLGSYYHGVESSFESVADAIEVAEQATTLAADLLVDHRRFQQQLSVDGATDSEISSLTAMLGPAVETWEQRIREAFDPSHEQVASLSFAELSHRLHDSVGPLAAMAEFAATTREIAGDDLTVAQIGQAFDDRAEIESIENELAEAEEADKALFGIRYQGVNTDWQAVADDVEWAERLRVVVDAPVEKVTAESLLDSDEDPHALDSLLKAWSTSRDSATQLFVGERKSEVAGDLDASYVDAEEFISDLQTTLSDIDEWEAFLRARNTLASNGLAATVEHAISQGIPSDQVQAAIERSTLEAWVDGILDADERLTHDRAADRDAFVEEFRKLDRRILDAAAADVMKSVNGRLPRSRLGPAGIIEREGQKKRRHMPVRDLIERTKDVVQAFKPCFMMSPLSVSQFLSPDVSFDLVIFDEASQVKPSDAVNCIYRGRQLVVAGDQKQLPPTTFFQRASVDGGDEYEEDQLDEFESVLDLAKAGGMESLPLSWHYRSQHESLITYSNYSFYDGRLITFPGALDQAPDVGIELFHVPEGEYRRGGARDNPPEARQVVDRVLFHMREHPDLTLGVVAFSEAQASLIEYLVDAKRAEHPELETFFGEDRLRGFFVKNLENVQGDERDVMIFSIGYGPDEMGKLTMNFGPLNRAGGERRLNVAITRARRRVEVVSSVRADDFTSTGTAGPRHLQRYLDYANRGVSALAIEISESQRDTESPFEEEVLRVIRSWGYDVTPQVGVAGYRVDLGISDPGSPGRYILGVECDGAMYHSSKVARDRDRLRQEVLEGLGWQLHRIWGTAWYQDRSTEEQRLAEAIEAARTGHERPSTQRKKPPKVPDLLEIDFDAVPEWVADYEVSRPSVPSYRDMSDPNVAPDMSVAIATVVRVESPVAKEVVLRRIREAWGVGRAGRRIRENFERALSLTGSVHKDRRNFLWDSNSEEVRVRRPSSKQESRRTIDEVALEELKLAVVNLVRDSKRATRDELTREAARLFGWQRKGSEIAEGLEKAVRSLLRGRVLVRDGGYVAVNDAGDEEKS